jgi:hypothetical protein
VVVSHNVFFDLTSGAMSGTINLDSAVVAILSSTKTLAASDFLISNGVEYVKHGNRSLEGIDKVEIVDSRNIRMRLFAASPGDYVRVLKLYSPGATPVADQRVKKGDN